MTILVCRYFEYMILIARSAFLFLKIIDNEIFIYYKQTLCIGFILESYHICTSFGPSHNNQPHPDSGHPGSDGRRRAERYRCGHADGERDDAWDQADLQGALLLEEGAAR